jgi:opacity protein-like surface antigen
MTEVNSQDENFLGLCFGGAIPQGSFSENTRTDSTSVIGYANNGFMFSFDAAYFPDDYLGIGATVTFASNNPDKKKYKDDLINSIVGDNQALEDTLRNNIDLDYGVWKYLNIFIGPNVTFPAGRFNIDLRIMGGLTLAWQPSQTIDINYPEQGSFSRKIEDKPVPTFGFSAGGGVRYAFKSGYVLRFIAEYSNSKPTFEVIDQITYDQEVESFVTTQKKIEMPIKNIHLGIGIAYNFEL